VVGVVHRGVVVILVCRTVSIIICILALLTVTLTLTFVAATDIIIASVLAIAAAIAVGHALVVDILSLLLAIVAVVVVAVVIISVILAPFRLAAVVLTPHCIGDDLNAVVCHDYNLATRAACTARRCAILVGHVGGAVAAREWCTQRASDER